MKISIKADFNPVEKLISAEAVKKAATETCKRLCKEVGKPRAWSIYHNAIYDGTNDVAVKDHAIKNGHCLETEGNAALYIEFGAGVYYNGSEAYPDPEGRPSGVDNIGEHGKGHGKNDYWYYPAENGTGSLGRDVSLRGTPYVRTFGNPPAAAMYHARNAMADKAQQIFNEELKNG